MTTPIRKLSPLAEHLVALDQALIVAAANAVHPVGEAAIASGEYNERDLFISMARVTAVMLSFAVQGILENDPAAPLRSVLTTTLAEAVAAIDATTDERDPAATAAIELFRSDLIACIELIAFRRDAS